MKNLNIHKHIAEKRTLTILKVAFVVLAYSHTAAAWEIPNPFAGDDLDAILRNIADFVIKIGIPLLILAIVVIGFMFVSAQGSEEKLRKAKGAFFWLIIGAVIILGARIIADIISNIADELSG